jgi:hypothetical protein
MYKRMRIEDLLSISSEGWRGLPIPVDYASHEELDPLRDSNMLDEAELMKVHFDPLIGVGAALIHGFGESWNVGLFVFRKVLSFAGDAFPFDTPMRRCWVGSTHVEKRGDRVLFVMQAGMTIEVECKGIEFFWLRVPRWGGEGSVDYTCHTAESVSNVVTGWDWECEVIAMSQIGSTS